MSSSNLHTMTYRTFQEDTIAAIATAIGPCGINIVRISGPDAFAVVGRIFKASKRPDISGLPSHTVHYGLVINPTTQEMLDQSLLTIFKGPASYTGEDTAEISCHGGIVTVKRILNAAFAAGARPAEPGEFTKRAFLNGRLDLAQAEAVNDLIRARTDDAQRLALRQLGGSLSSEVTRITDNILDILARIEAAVDFPEDVDEPDYPSLGVEITAILNKIAQLIATSDRGRVFREGISLAIVGRPNVGKSSLLNALLRQSRAIVTPVPGTTRDVIEETINVMGIPVVAADTAGIRMASDEVEQIGVELTERMMAAAGIILVVLDGIDGLTEEDIKIIERSGDNVIIVVNKSDAIADTQKSDLMEFISTRLPNLPIIPVSALTGAGIEALENTIAQTVLKGDIGDSEGALVTNLRHKQALILAQESISRSLETIQQGLPIDFLTVDLIAARLSLGDITGDTASEDLINKIFQDFCIGK